MVQGIKNLPTMREAWFQSLCWEDHLEKRMATHSSNLTPGESHGQRGLAGYSPWGRKESHTTEQLMTKKVVINFIDAMVK